MSKTSEKLNLGTGANPVRLSYVNFVEKVGFDDNTPEDKKAYQCSILISKDDKETYNKLKVAISKVASETWGDKGNAKIKDQQAKDKLIHDGDNSESEDYKNHWHIAVKNYSKRPVCLDRKKKEIDLEKTKDEVIYSGCYAIVSITAYSKTDSNPGVFFGLNGLQKVKDGDRLGGTTFNADEFDDLGDDELYELSDDDLPF